jgi:2-oxoglutarate dehydrogenase complex dehydrogenase (E1) component-like enzyme
VARGFSHQPEAGLQTQPSVQTAQQPPAERVAAAAPTATAELMAAAPTV